MKMNEDNIHSTKLASSPIPSTDIKARKTYSTPNIQAVRRFSNSGNGFMKRPIYRGSSQRIYKDINRDEEDADDDISIVDPVDEWIAAPRKMWYHNSKIVNFYTLYTGLHILVTIIAGGIIANVDGYDYLDGFFMAISAITGSSLVTIVSSRCSAGTFTIFALLIYFGCHFWVLGIWPSLGKYYLYRQKRAKVHMDQVLDKKAVRHFNTRYDAVEANVIIMISYNFLWHSFTTLALIGALRLRPIHPQLEARNFSREVFAFFVAICGYGNTGFSLSDDALFYYIDNPLFYFIVSLSIMAGLCMAPVFLRIYINIVIRVRLMLNYRVSAYENLLQHGEDYNLFLFSYKKTLYLFIANIVIYALQFCFWMFSTFTTENIALYGSVDRLVGLGYFHAIASRYCGYQMVDFQKLNIGMLVVYALAMYTFSIPFLSADIFNENISLVTPKDNKMGEDNSSFDEKQTIKKDKKIVNDDSQKNSTAIFNTEAIKKTIIANLASHSFWLVVAVVVIAHTESELIKSNPSAYNLWFIFFEMFSAYGTVGFSVGVATQPPGYSLCGDFSQAGKLVIMCLMMLGKHRGMPDPDSFCMDFNLSEFNEFTLADNENDSDHNNNDDYKPIISIDGIELNKKKSYVDLTELLNSMQPNTEEIDNNNSSSVNDTERGLYSKPNSDFIKYDI